MPYLIVPYRTLCCDDIHSSRSSRSYICRYGIVMIFMVPPFPLYCRGGVFLIKGAKQIIYTPPCSQNPPRSRNVGIIYTRHQTLRVTVRMYCCSSTCVTVVGPAPYCPFFIRQPAYTQAYDQDMLCRICIVPIQSKKYVLAHKRQTPPIRQHGVLKQ